MYRLPIVLEDPNEIKSVHDGLRLFEMDKYVDRICNLCWKEQNMEDLMKDEEVDLCSRNCYWKL